MYIVLLKFESFLWTMALEKRTLWLYSGGFLVAYNAKDQWFFFFFLQGFILNFEGWQTNQTFALSAVPSSGFHLPDAVPSSVDRIVHVFLTSNLPTFYQAE